MVYQMLIDDNNIIIIIIIIKIKYYITICTFIYTNLFQKYFVLYMVVDYMRCGTFSFFSYAVDSSNRFVVNEPMRS